ncbi:hypothetical protein C1141_17825, partial [Vibrio agarivorans]
FTGISKAKAQLEGMVPVLGEYVSQSNIDGIRWISTSKILVSQQRDMFYYVGYFQYYSSIDRLVLVIV